jgi:DNA-nicking Smr family endonuclease
LHAGARSGTNRGTLDPAADEYFDVRFSDRFLCAHAPGVSRETLAKLERGEFAVRSHVDLHGMALDDARSVVDEFLAERQRHGERCVLVITGKGRNSRQQVGVLREKIPEWLARGPSARRVLAFVTARQCDGGEGALYVLLRKRASAKARIDVIAGGGG